MSFESTYIYCILRYPGAAKLNLNRAFNFSNYNYIKTDVQYTGAVTNSNLQFSINGTTSGGSGKTYTTKMLVNPGGNYTLSIALPDKTVFTVSVILYDHDSNAGSKSCKVFRIYFA